MRLISLRVAKSTTAKPLKSVNCTKIHLVEPSGFATNAIGRTPRSMSSVQAGCSVCASNTLIGLARDRAGHDVLAVGRDVRVVDAALRLQRLDVLQRRRVDHVDAARRLDDPDVDAPAVAADGDVVRVAAQRNPVRHLQRLGVDDVERAVGFVADVDAAAVRRDRRAVVHFDPVDDADDLVGAGIDDVDVVAGAVGLDDSDLLALCWHARRDTAVPKRTPRPPSATRDTGADCFVIASPTLSGLPLRIVLRIPVLAAVVKEVAARLFGERVHSAAGFSGCRHATRWTASKFLRESSSLQVVLPAASGCSRSGVPLAWHEMQRAWPGRLARKIGWTFVLKNS